MPPTPPPARRAQLTGNRIRERRLMEGLKQAELAEEVGISASYLNLIEHNRRRIGGKLLVKIARVLEVEPAALSEGADASLYDALQAAAQDASQGLRLRPETERIDEFEARFPGWTGLVAAQHRRIASLEATVEGLRDRLSHDPVLAESMHEVLSTVAAIRSTADILVREPDLDPQWRGRFHRNVHEEAERLSARATELLGHFEAQDRDARPNMSTPIETVEAMFDAADHHFPLIEAEGTAAIPTVIERAAGMEDAATRALAERQLTRYAQDAARLPLALLQPAAEAAAYDPAALAPMAHGDMALLLRRIATLPPQGDGLGEMPAFGLAICDASGALTFRRRTSAFSIPRFGHGCPLWPLYRALSRPGIPETAILETPQGGQFSAWAVSQPTGDMQFGQAPSLEAVMLIQPLSAAPAPRPPMAPIMTGPGCDMCPRVTCAARR